MIQSRFWWENPPLKSAFRFLPVAYPPLPPPDRIFNSESFPMDPNWGVSLPPMTIIKERDRLFHFSPFTLLPQDRADPASLEQGAIPQPLIFIPLVAFSVAGQDTGIVRAKISLETP